MASATVEQRALVPEIMDRVTEFVPFMAKDAIKLTVRMVKDMCCQRTKKGFVCDDQQAMKFIMLCKARLLNPFDGDAFLLGYDSEKDGPTFSLITAHQAFLKRAEVHSEYDGLESGVIVQDRNGDMVDREGDFLWAGDVLLGGWATVHLKNRKFPMKKRLNLSTFHTGRSRWNKDPAGMIVKCSEADALRSAFPTSLGGMYLEGEMPAAVSDQSSHAAIPAPSAVPAATRADALANRLAAPSARNQTVPVNLKPAAQPEKVPVATKTESENGNGDHISQDAPGRDEAPETANGTTASEAPSSEDHGDAYEGDSDTPEGIAAQNAEIARQELASEIRLKIRASRKSTAGKVRKLIDDRLGDLGVELHKALTAELQSHIASIVGE